MRAFSKSPITIMLIFIMGAFIDLVSVRSIEFQTTKAAFGFDWYGIVILIVLLGVFIPYIVVSRRKDSSVNRRLKLKPKYVLPFVLSVSSLIVVIIYLVLTLRDDSEGFVSFIENDQVIIMELNNMYAQGLQTEQSTRNMMFTTNDAYAARNYKKASESFDQSRMTIKTLVEPRSVIDKTMDQLGELWVLLDVEKMRVRELAAAGDLPGAIDHLVKIETPKWREIRDIMVALMKERNELVEITKETAQQDSASGLWTSIVLSIVVIVLSIIIVLFSAKNFVTPIQEIEHLARKLALGETDVTLDQSREDEIGDLSRSFGSMIVSIKEQSSNAALLAAGDYSSRLQVRSEKDMLNKSWNTVSDTLQSVIKEINSVSKNAIEGKLDTRGNAAGFSGAYKEILTGINSVLDSFILPIREGSQVLSLMAKGDLTERVTGEYRGDLVVLKESINQVADSLSAALREVRDTISITASSANQISSSSEELAAGAQEQSSQSSEILHYCPK